MVILQVKVRDFAILDPESDAPIAGNGDAPYAGTVASKLMDAPTRWAAHLLHVGSVNQGTQDILDPLHLICTHTSWVIVFEQGVQSFMI